MKTASTLLLPFLALPAFAEPQKFSAIGDLKLVSGQMLRDCRAKYRTFGQMNHRKPNIILDNPCSHSLHACPDNGMGQEKVKFLGQ